MKQRTMDEMISYFNQEVSKMDIDQSYKMALLGMICAIGAENKKQEIIYCKDCVKHNRDIGDFQEFPNGSRHWYWKPEACPLVQYRGKAQGHEFDYQYCIYAKRREESNDK